MRSALVEGASWWAKAFEAAGFKNAFKVEVLPDDADPMDLRYNVIQWVHRSTRGWSYGTSVIDPRTGEILKGRVTLDSLRARQDALIGTGLSTGRAAPGRLRRRGRARVPEYLAGARPDGRARGDGPGPHPPALGARGRPHARPRPQLRRQHLRPGLGDGLPRAPRQDPRRQDARPLRRLRQGHRRLRPACAIRYAYAQFPPGADEAKELGEIVRKGVADGLLFLSDADARPAGAAHPLANLWDNGDDPVASLRHEMKVRRDRPRTVRPRPPRRRGAAVRPRSQAPAALPAPPLPAPGGRQDAGRACDTPTP